MHKISRLRPALVGAGIAWLALTPACGDDDTAALDAGPVTDASGPLDAATAPDDGGVPDAGPMLPPTPPLELGEPLLGSRGVWTWNDFPDTQCMDGTSFGVGVNMSPDSEDVVIVFEGGNLCFDALSCYTVANPDGFTSRDLRAQVGSASGLFNRADPDNPVRDFNFVFIPYCSGDLHVGNHPDGYEGNQYFGYANTTRFLGRIAPTFASAAKVVVTGSSAGGLGALGSFHQTAEAFEAAGSTATLYLLDDSGPVMSDTYLRPCFQRRMRDTFGLASVPLFATDCTACTNADGGGLGRLFAWITATHPTVRVGFATHDTDRTMRTFFSYGYSAGCDFPAVMPAADFAAGLHEIEDELGAEDNFAMFVVPGEAHTFLGSALGTATAGTTTLAEWLTQMLNDDPAWDTEGTIP